MDTAEILYERYTTLKTKLLEQFLWSVTEDTEVNHAK